ncbi:MAG: DeoR/GlpR family DNA-binding transcription regulator [Sphaerochaetaceae bacterium]|nr:DeoR/GlpR family DNA-binding transcription regulator [Spirochaetales bacterium]MDY5499698.1 DeoR/GlpR family DNA-binding transcription regulator [Sphaerochaetaceae bacterium]
METTEGKLSLLRREQIYQVIQKQSMAKVEELAKLTGMTTMTIRRDLEYLEKRGLVERVRGGAVLINRNLLATAYNQKNMLHFTEKNAIAARAADYIKDNDTIFINGGSTTLRLFGSISAQYVKIVSNNAYFPFEHIHPGVSVISTGGQFNAESYTFVGDFGTQSVAGVWADKAFIGLDGIDAKRGLTTNIQSEGQINRLMIAHTKGDITVLADSTKIGNVANFLFSPISSVKRLITDHGISVQHQRGLEECGIEVIVV